jgi:ZIP family zinc transporter
VTVSLEKTLLLGLIAGGTILLGLPIARLRRPVPNLRIMLNAVAVGILVFLVWDVLSAAWLPIDNALTDFHDGNGGLARASGYGVLFAGGLAVGLLAMIVYEHWMSRETRRLSADVDTAPPDQTAREPMPTRGISGAMAGGMAGAATLTLAPPRRGITTWTPARQLALLIAIGIGLHNFAEGLAIGQAAANSEIALATLLVIGFALHNATEGFGIVAPLAGEMTEDGERILPSWGFLLAMGAIGGGPTFLGTAVGHAFTSEAMSVVFLSLAAGSILYVVVQLTGIAAKHRRMDLLAYGLLIGLILGFLTDAIVTAAGV